MSLLTKVLGVDKQIAILEEEHKKELTELENSYIGEVLDLRESLASDLKSEVEGWTSLFKGEHELEKADREGLLEQCWNGFCKSPLLRAIVKYTTIFVFGKGIKYEIDDPEAKAYIDEFCRVNKLDQLQKKLSDELQIYGELFLYTPESELIENESLTEAAIQEAVNAGGKKETLKIRIREAKENDATTKHPEVFDLIPIDPAEIQEIETDEYDIRKVKRYKRVYTTASGAQVTDWIPASEVQHISVNCATNSKRGRSDLESMLLWSFRYGEFLKNRTLLNKLKRAIFFDVTVDGTPAEVAAEKAKYPKGPKFGSVIFHNKSVEWKVVEPKMDARQAEADGRAIRQIIAIGAMLPEYMLSEGRGTTYSTGRVQEPVILRKFINYQDLWEFEFILLFRHILALAVKYKKLPETYKDGKGDTRKTISVPIRVFFPELKKEDILNIAKAMALLFDVGLSKETIYAQGGFDYKTEKKRKKKEEEEEEMEEFKRGEYSEGGD